MALHETGPADPLATPRADTFALVVEAHWTAVYKLVYSLTGDTHNTEDLTQETFLRALNRLDTFRPGTNLRSWLLRIASNAFFDWQRKRKRARVQPLAHDPPAATPQAGHALEVAEQSKLLEVALEELSDKTRLVFHLRAQEGLSFREIAELVGTTEQAARWFMHQARTKLLKRLGKEL